MSNPQVLRMYLVADINYPIIRQKMVYQSACDTLNKASGVAEKLAFAWKELTTPNDGQCFLMFMPVNLNPSPPDGIEWRDQEKRTSINLPDGKELLIYEKKEGCLPGRSDSSMIRRRFVLDNKKEVQLQLFHYLSHNSDASTNFMDKAAMYQSYNPMLAARNLKPGSNLAPIMPYQNNLQNVQHLKNNLLKGGEIKNNPYKIKRNNYLSDRISMNPMDNMNKMNRNPNDPAMSHAQQLAAIQPNLKVIYGDDLDLVNIKDVATQRYKRNHDMVAEIFDPIPCSRIQKDIKEIKLPANKVKLDEFLIKYKKDIEDIKRVKKEHDRSQTNLSSLLNKQFNELKHCTQAELLSKSKHQIEAIFGPLSDRRIPIKPVNNAELQSDDNVNIIAL
ncbi:hypothetical protein K502DRAFT_342090 [Neoconidiobolus thromboides FSU 785]|nr:hypothetical protein K502DRAFT_342090 [Neoconidiobolus thromboides FSU 785]